MKFLKTQRFKTLKRLLFPNGNLHETFTINFDQSIIIDHFETPLLKFYPNSKLSAPSEMQKPIKNVIEPINKNSTRNKFEQCWYTLQNDLNNLMISGTKINIFPEPNLVSNVTLHFAKWIEFQISESEMVKGECCGMQGRIFFAGWLKINFEGFIVEINLRQKKWLYLPLGSSSK